MSETLGKLIPLNSGCTTTDKNSAEHFEKNTDILDNEMDQSCDELLYISAVETELILQDITNITEIENRTQSSTIVQAKVNNEIQCTRNEKLSFIFKDCNVNFYYNQ
jgi:nitrous oxide reductase